MVQAQKTKPWRQSTGSRESKVKGHQVLAQHILQERLRLGGNFVATSCLESKLLRDAVKEITGPDTIFIVLCLDAELQAKHLEHRIPGNLKGQESIKSNFHYYSPAGMDEPNTFNVNVTESKTPNDLAREILSLIDDKFIDNQAHGIEHRHPKDTMVPKAFENVLKHNNPLKTDEILSLVGHKWNEFSIVLPLYVCLLLALILIIILYSPGLKVFGFRMVRSIRISIQLFKSCRK